MRYHTDDTAGTSARPRTARMAAPQSTTEFLRLRFLAIAALAALVAFGLTACAEEWDDGPDATDPSAEVDDREVTDRGDAGLTGRDAVPPAQQQVAQQAMLPTGAVLRFEVMETVSTEDNSAGDEVELRLVETVRGTDGAELPEGTTAVALVTEAHESEGPEDEAVLAVQVASIEVNGNDRALSGTVEAADTETAARASGQRTAATVVTGAAAGAVIGQVLGRDRRSTVAGAAAGAVAGLGIALTTRDGHAVLPEGSVITVRLDEPLPIR